MSYVRGSSFRKGTCLVKYLLCFDIMDCKSMDISMMKKLKKLKDFVANLVDSLIDSLIYLWHILMISFARSYD